MQKEKTRENVKRLLRKMTFTAVFAALAVVVKSFTNLALNIPGVGVKIGFSGIFTFFPAAFCGPVYGGVASALSDVLGYLIAPDGAYIPWLTITAFAGGVIKGLLWMLLTKKTEKRVRISLAAVFCAVGLFGAAVNISLVSDKVMSGIIANQTDLPGRGAMDRLELSPLSKFATSLAKYNKDTVTLTKATGKDMRLPDAYDDDGYVITVTKIADGALSDCEGSLYIPSVYKTISADAGTDNIELILGEKGSAAEKYAAEHGIGFEEYEKSDGDGLQEGSFEFRTSDTYRKYLASYINLVCFGLELAGAVGLLFVALDLILEKRSKNDAGKSRELCFMKIAVCTVVTGVVITTVNTFILRELLDAWRGRTVYILLIPRIAEELVSCTVQAYLISLLFGAVYRGKLRQYIDMLR